MDSAGWTKIDYDEAWVPFDARFDFRPSYSDSPKQIRSTYAKVGRAAILEPSDSITYSISGIYGDEQRYQDFTRELTRAVLHGFRLLTKPDAPLIVLDWQHPAYSWNCHAQAESDDV